MLRDSWHAPMQRGIFCSKSSICFCYYLFFHGLLVMILCVRRQMQFRSRSNRLDVSGELWTWTWTKERNISCMWKDNHFIKNYTITKTVFLNTKNSVRVILVNSINTIQQTPIDDQNEINREDHYKPNIDNNSAIMFLYSMNKFPVFS